MSQNYISYMLSILDLHPPPLQYAAAESPEEDDENTILCGTNGETYSSLCELLQDTGNEGVAYAGSCDREECDGGEVRAYPPCRV